MTDNSAPSPFLSFPPLDHIPSPQRAHTAFGKQRLIRGVDVRAPPPPTTVVIPLRGRKAIRSKRENDVNHLALQRMAGAKSAITLSPRSKRIKQLRRTRNQPVDDNPRLPQLFSFLETATEHEVDIIDLSHMQLEPDEYVAVGCVLRAHPTIEGIILTGNDIDPLRAKALCAVVADNKSLTNVVVEEERMPRSWFQKLNELVSRNQRFVRRRERRKWINDERALYDKSVDLFCQYLTEFFLEEMMQREGIVTERATEWAELSNQYRTEGKKQLAKQRYFRLQEAILERSIQMQSREVKFRALIAVEWFAKTTKLLLIGEEDARAAFQRWEASTRHNLKDQEKRGWVVSRRKEHDRKERQRLARQAIEEEETHKRNLLDEWYENASATLEENREIDMERAQDAEDARRAEERRIAALKRRAEEIAREKKEKEEKERQLALNRFRAEQRRERERVESEHNMVKKKLTNDRMGFYRLVDLASSAERAFLKSVEKWHEAQRRFREISTFVPDVSLEFDTTPRFYVQGTWKPVDLFPIVSVDFVLPPAWHTEAAQASHSLVTSEIALLSAAKALASAREDFETLSIDSSVSEEERASQRQLQARLLESLVTLEQNVQLPKEPRKTMNSVSCRAHKLAFLGGSIRVVSEIAEHSNDHKNDIFLSNTQTRSLTPPPTMRPGTVRFGVKSQQKGRHLKQRVLPDEEELPDEAVKCHYDYPIESLAMGEGKPFFMRLKGESIGTSPPASQRASPFPEAQDLSPSGSNGPSSNGPKIITAALSTIAYRFTGSNEACAIPLPHERRMRVEIEVIFPGLLQLEEQDMEMSLISSCTAKSTFKINVLCSNPFVSIPMPLRFANYEAGGTPIDGMVAFSGLTCVVPPAYDDEGNVIEAPTGFLGSKITMAIKEAHEGDFFCFVSNRSQCYLHDLAGTAAIFFKKDSEVIEALNVTLGELPDLSTVASNMPQFQNTGALFHRIEFVVKTHLCNAVMLRRVLSRVRFCNLRRNADVAHRTLALSVADSYGRQCTVNVDVGVFLKEDTPTLVLKTNQVLIRKIDHCTKYTLLHCLRSRVGLCRDAVIEVPEKFDFFVGGYLTVSCNEENAVPGDCIALHINGHFSLKDDKNIFLGGELIGIVEEGVATTRFDADLDGSALRLRITFSASGTSLETVQELLNSVVFCSSKSVVKHPPSRKCDIVFQLGNTCRLADSSLTTREIDSTQWGEPATASVLVSVCPSLISVSSTHPATIEHAEGGPPVKIGTFDVKDDTTSGTKEMPWSFVKGYVLVEVIDGFSDGTDTFSLAKKADDLAIKPLKTAAEDLITPQYLGDIMDLLNRDDVEQFLSQDPKEFIHSSNGSVGTVFVKPSSVLIVLSSTVPVRKKEVTSMLKSIFFASGLGTVTTKKLLRICVKDMTQSPSQCFSFIEVDKQSGVPKISSTAVWPVTIRSTFSWSANYFGGCVFAPHSTTIVQPPEEVNEGEWSARKLSVEMGGLGAKEDTLEILTEDEQRSLWSFLLSPDHQQPGDEDEPRCYKQPIVSFGDGVERPTVSFEGSELTYQGKLIAKVLPLEEHFGAARKGLQISFEPEFATSEHVRYVLSCLRLSLGPQGTSGERLITVRLYDNVSVGGGKWQVRVDVKKSPITVDESIDNLVHKRGGARTLPGQAFVIDPSLLIGTTEKADSLIYGCVSLLVLDPPFERDSLMLHTEGAYSVKEKDGKLTVFAVKEPIGLISTDKISFLSVKFKGKVQRTKLKNVQDFVRLLSFSTPKNDPAEPDVRKSVRCAIVIEDSAPDPVFIPMTIQLN